MIQYTSIPMFVHICDGKIVNTKYYVKIEMEYQYPITSVSYTMKIGSKYYSGYADINLTSYVCGDSLIFTGGQENKANSEFLEGIDDWNKLLNEKFQFSLKDIGFESYDLDVSLPPSEIATSSVIVYNQKIIYDYILQNGQSSSDPNSKYITQRVDGNTVFLQITDNEEIEVWMYYNDSKVSITLKYPQTVVSYNTTINYKTYRQEAPLNMQTYRKWTALSFVGDTSVGGGDVMFKQIMSSLETILDEKFNMSMYDIGFLYYNGNGKKNIENN